MCVCVSTLDETIDNTDHVTWSVLSMVELIIMMSLLFVQVGQYCESPTNSIIEGGDSANDSRTIVRTTR